MKYYETYLYEGEDLSLDEIEIDEEIAEIPEQLQPTEEMQARFLCNCEELGILKRVSVH